MLNKPRGLVTTASDEKARETVFSRLAGKGLPFVAPVGRLDKASEGLLLFTNDTAWAAKVTDPSSRIQKTYHVQIDRVVDDVLLAQMRRGVDLEGETLKVKAVKVLRQGEKTCWIEVALEEGKNRHIRRMADALGLSVLRLVRVAIGSLPLGNLPKGESRLLTEMDLRAIGVEPA
jgi:23S rRNA pseudouridine2605 synthase